jgi:hypothetical protein
VRYLAKLVKDPNLARHRQNGTLAIEYVEFVELG